MEVHVSGDNPKFVDGERDEFIDYADKKAVRVEKLTDAEVMHVRLGIEGRKVKVSVDVDGDYRTDDIGSTAFSAVDRAVDTLVNRLRKAQDKRVQRRYDPVSTLGSDADTEEDYYNEETK